MRVLEQPDRDHHYADGRLPDAAAPLADMSLPRRSCTSSGDSSTKLFAVIRARTTGVCLLGGVGTGVLDVAGEATEVTRGTDDCSAC